MKTQHKKKIDQSHNQSKGTKKRNFWFFALLLVFLFLLFLFSDQIMDRNQDNVTLQTKENHMENKTVTLPSGLKYEILKKAPQPSKKPQQGQMVVVHYTGWLEEDGKLGRKFDSSVDRGQVFSFPLGRGRVIKGWDEGVADMEIGETRRLTIPSNLGYGASGTGGIIPPNATLIFDVELIEVK